MILQILQFAVIAVVGVWALFLYMSNKKNNDLQTISRLWNTYQNTEAYVAFFSLWDAEKSSDTTLEQLRELPVDSLYLNNALKYKLLAFTEEIALTASYHSSIKKELTYLFRWHFRYIYFEEATQCRFWYSLSGVSDTDNISEVKEKIHSQINLHSWKLQYDFAKECMQSFHSEGR